MDSSVVPRELRIKLPKVLVQHDPLARACMQSLHPLEELILSRISKWSDIISPILQYDGNHIIGRFTYCMQECNVENGRNFNVTSETITMPIVEFTDETRTYNHDKNVVSCEANIVHVASAVANRTLLQQLLELPRRWLNPEADELKLRVREWASEHNVSIMTGGIAMLFEHDETLDRSDAPAGEKARIMFAKEQQRRLVNSLEDVERLRVLMHERAYQSIVGCVDQNGQTPLFYAAAAKGGLSADTLLSAELFGGKIDSVGMSGRFLFPTNCAVCLVTGKVYSPQETAYLLELNQQNQKETLPQLQSQADKWIRIAYEALQSTEQMSPEEIFVQLAEEQTDEYPIGTVTRDDILQQHFDVFCWLHNLFPMNQQTPETVISFQNAMQSGKVPVPPFVTKHHILKHRTNIVQFGDVLSGATALHSAAAYNNVRVIRALLHHGASPNARMENQKTSLDLATATLSRTVQVPLRKAIEEACGLLHPSNVYLRENTGRMDSTSSKHLLQQLGSGVSARTKGVAGGVPLGSGLHAAAATGRADIAQLLLSNGADIDALDANGMTPLMICAAHARGGGPYLEVAQLLIENNADPNATSSMQRAALHYVCNATSFPASKHRFMRFSDHSDSGKHEQIDRNTLMTLQHMAVARFIAFLVHAGAIIDARDHRGDTPLHYTARAKHSIACAILLQLGAFVYAKNYVNDTALHTAAYVGAKHVARLLVRHDAEFGYLKSLRNAHNKYAFDIAKNDQVRRAMHTYWECAAYGDLNRLSDLLVQTENNLPNDSLSQTRQSSSQTRQSSSMSPNLQDATESSFTDQTLHASCTNMDDTTDTAHRKTNKQQDLQENKFSSTCMDQTDQTQTSNSMNQTDRAQTSNSMDQTDQTQTSNSIPFDENVIQEVSNEIMAHCQPALPWSRTRILRRTVIHCLITGCARKRYDLYMAIARPPEQRKSRKTNNWTNFQHVQVGVGGSRGKFARGTNGGNKGLSLRSGSGTSMVDSRKARSISGIYEPNDPDTLPPTSSSVGVLAGIGLVFDRYGRSEPHGVKHPIHRAHIQKVPAARPDWERLHVQDTDLQLQYTRLAGLLIERGGVDIDAADVDGVTALMLSARYGLITMMKGLVERGANILATDACGNTALHWAFAFGQKESVEILVELDREFHPMKTSNAQSSSTSLRQPTVSMEQSFPKNKPTVSMKQSFPSNQPTMNQPVEEEKSVISTGDASNNDTFDQDKNMKDSDMMYHTDRQRCGIVSVRNSAGRVADEVRGWQLDIICDPAEYTLELAAPPVESSCLLAYQPEELRKEKAVVTAYAHRKQLLDKTQRSAI